MSDTIVKKNNNPTTYYPTKQQGEKESAVAGITETGGEVLLSESRRLVWKALVEGIR